MPTHRSLWGDDIVIDSKGSTQKTIDKLSSSKKAKDISAEKAVKSKNVSIEDKIRIITAQVERVLGKFKEMTQVITDRQELHDYISKSIENGIVAIDTETNNSLDYLNCLLMGACIYTPGLKNVYVPINHINKYTGERLPYQLTEQDIKEEFDRLKDTRIVFHNAKFDYQVLKCTCNCALGVYWDTMIGARMLDENEQSASLKSQYIDKIDPTIEKYSIEKLFEGLEYAIFDPQVFALYSATDPYMTYELYLYQLEQMNKEGMEGVKRLFEDVEMQIVIPVAEMELRGVAFDLEYNEKLRNKYTKSLEELDKKIQGELGRYRVDIQKWRESSDGKSMVGKKTKSSQLTDPINVDSPTQLAIILYDVLKVPSVNSKQPRSTGKDDLKEIAKRNDISLCKLLLERKVVSKLLNDFVIKLPKLLNNKDNRIHCSFNQCGKEEDGVVTGRFSSSDPNLQQVPSREKSIRMMFCASEGHKIVGGDYSAQEPRLVTAYSGDRNMLQAYRDKRDLYAVIASMCFNKEYGDCLEFYPEGKEIVVEGKKVVCGYKTHKNEDGAVRRSQAKFVLLGLLYGRGAGSISEQIKKSREEAQEIIDKFFESFPSVKKWIDETHEKARKLEYVEDWYGRRRRLPNINLPEYEVKYKGDSGSTFNPILFTVGAFVRDETKLNKYRQLCQSCKRRSDVNKVISDAQKEGVEIIQNSNLIAEAERQSVNSIVQGGAATLTKMAMRNIYNDPVLKSLDFHMLITVHDEILGECPEENAEKAAERLAEVMKSTSKPYMAVPMEVDTYVVSHWYEDEYAAVVNDEFEKMVSGGMSKEEAFENICSKRIESTREELKKILGV